jgi:hypothetical protein
MLPAPDIMRYTITEDQTGRIITMTVPPTSVNAGSTSGTALATAVSVQVKGSPIVTGTKSASSLNSEVSWRTYSVLVCLAARLIYFNNTRPRIHEVWHHIVESFWNPDQNTQISTLSRTTHSSPLQKSYLPRDRIQRAGTASDARLVESY